MSFLSLHQAIERNTGLLIFGILVVASIGGLVQVLPSMLDDSLDAPAANVVPYARSSSSAATSTSANRARRATRSRCGRCSPR